MFMSLTLWLLVGYVCLTGGIVLLLVIGGKPKYQQTAVGAASRALQRVPSKVIHGVLWCVFCGQAGKAQAASRSLEHRLCHRRNPLLQLFYFVLTLPAMYGHVAWSLPLRRDTYHTVSPAYVMLSQGLCLVGLGTFAVASIADPGTVEVGHQQDATVVSNSGGSSAAAKARRSGGGGSHTDSSRSSSGGSGRYGYDGVVYSPGPACRTCQVPKPARSKHCRICGRCVRRFDHHCAWLNTDVGENNTRFFHLFLMWHVGLAAHVCWTGAMSLWEYIDANGLLTSYYRSGDGQVIQATWGIVLAYTMQRHALLTALTVYAGLIAILLFVFWASYLKGALLNRTSNEAAKIEDLAEQLMEETRLPAPAEAATANEPAHDADVTVVPLAKASPTAHEAAPPPSWRPRKGDVDWLMRQATRYYHRGVIANVWEIVSPHSPVPRKAPIDTSTWGRRDADSEGSIIGCFGTISTALDSAAAKCDASGRPVADTASPNATGGGPTKRRKREKGHI